MKTLYNVRVPKKKGQEPTAPDTHTQETRSLARARGRFAQRILCRSLFDTSMLYVMKIYVRCCSPLRCMGLSLPCAVRDMICCAGRHVELINYGELINH